MSNLTLVVLADLVVLAIHAAQVAIPEENIPGTTFPDKRRFFTEVGTIRAYNRKITRIAPCHFASLTIDPAIEGTDIARRKHLIESVYPSFQFPGFV
jgi:hypothetical protein